MTFHRRPSVHRSKPPLNSASSQTKTFSEPSCSRSVEDNRLVINGRTLRRTASRIICASRASRISASGRLKRDAPGSVRDKHTKGRMGGELEERSRMGNLWLMIGHAVGQKVEGVLVRLRAGVGEGMRIPVYIYCPSAHRLFKIDRCRGRCFKWHPRNTQRWARWQKPNKPC